MGPASTGFEVNGKEDNWWGGSTLRCGHVAAFREIVTFVA